MEETKELQTTYKIFRYLIYMSLIVEFSSMPLILNYWIIGVVSCAIFMTV